MLGRRAGGGPLPAGIARNSQDAGNGRIWVIEAVFLLAVVAVRVCVEGGKSWKVSGCVTMSQWISDTF